MSTEQKVDDVEKTIRACERKRKARLQKIKASAKKVRRNEQKKQSKRRRRDKEIIAEKEKRNEQFKQSKRRSRARETTAAKRREDHSEYVALRRQEEKDLCDLRNKYEELNRSMNHKKLGDIGKAVKKLYVNTGGIENTVSLIELKKILNKKMKIKNEPILIDNPRPSDQIIYISDITKVKKDFDWQPKINLSDGLDSVLLWLNETNLLWAK